MKKLYTLTVSIAVLLVLFAFGASDFAGLATGKEPAAANKPDEAAVKRARKTVQTLDTIFKQTVVLITDKYVHDEDDFAAGSAAVLLFKNISAAGDNTVRLIDATGQPYDEKNVASDDFEREGIKRLKAGAAVYDQVISTDGKHQLRSLTTVPVVMKKCIMCHDHYADVKEGQPIGAISYTVPIE